MRTVIGPVMDVKQCKSKANPCFLELFGRVICAVDFKSGDPEFRFCSRKLNVELLGPVVRSLVSANCWLRGSKTYRFP